MKLNSKGQVTIPAPLRARYGLHEGDEVEVIDDQGALRIVRASDAPTRGQRIAARLRGSATAKDVQGLTTDELMELLRGE